MRFIILFLIVTATHAASLVPFNPQIRTVVASGGSFPTTSLVAHYRFNEASGDATDTEVGARTLTASGSPGSTTGKVGNCRTITRATPDYFTSTGFTFGDQKFAIGVGVYLTSKPSDPMYIVSKATGGGAGGREFEIFWDNATDRFVMKTGGGINVTATANTFGAPSLNTWYYIYAYHNSVTDEIGISVDGGAFDTASTSGSFAGTTTGAFCVGNYDTGVGSIWNLNGRVDHLSVWISNFNTADAATIVNGGTWIDR